MDEDTNPIKPKADIVFEVSWEVANKVGGINTVLVSKASEMVNIYQDNFYMVGPYKPDQFKGEFHEIMPPSNFMDIWDELLKEGIRVHFGKWLIKGEPWAILVDTSDFLYKTNEIKNDLWNNFKIDSLNSPWDYNEVIVWSTAAGKLIEKLSKVFADKKIVAHCHEWLAAGALLHLKEAKANVATVFTTHATVLGRSIAGAGVNLYEIMDTIDPMKEIYNYHIQAKALTEMAAAEKTDVFTTVSSITNEEAAQFLKRDADVLLPNGLEISKFPNMEEITLNHRLKRNKMRSFLLYYFMPYYSMDVENTLFYFLTGRYEFENKGIDVYVKALGKLNEKLKSVKDSKTIVAFIFVPSDVKGIDLSVINSREVYREVEGDIEDAMNDIKNNVLCSMFNGKANENDILSKDLMEGVEAKVRSIKKTSGRPPIVTHVLNYDNDVTLAAIKEAGLNNDVTDKVKIVFYPVYVQGNDGILDMEYYDVLAGSHLGIFPSFYEPWGYTPLETAALGVSTITTDLAGFGRYMQKYIPESSKYPGIFILHRYGKAEDKVVDELVDVMFKFLQNSTRERIENKLQARRLASLVDWKFLVRNYIEAHNLAVDKLNSD